ncbi:MAG: hypothetical protein NVV74_22595 [Magnetospirillum sp.]|nr:hypothetical protein [Magnetospirillum sp.]
MDQLIPRLLASPEAPHILNVDQASFPVVDGDTFGKLIQHSGFEERVRQYVARIRSQNKEFNGLFDGRLESSFVERGIILSSVGCIICGNDAGLAISTIGYEEALMIGFYLCPSHLGEARAKSETFIHYIFDALGATFPINTLPPPPDFLVVAARHVLINQFACHIEKHTNCTITGICPSGFKIIMRVNSVDDYAYMIFSPDGAQIARIDCAEHHDIPYGPDHMHIAPEVDNKNVVPSFTYGIPLADIKAIRRILDDNKG